MIVVGRCLTTATRWVVLADAHVGTAETQFPNQDYRYAADVLRLAVPIIDRLDPDEVFVVGDLVNMGTDDEYRLVGEILAGVRAPISTIAGNHEVVRAGLGEFQRLAPGARSNVATLFDDAVVVFLTSAIEGLPLSQWHGRIGDDGLALLDRTSLEYPDRPLIVFCHHPPENTVAVPNLPMMSVLNSRALVARLERHQAPVLMLCGHTHIGDVYRRRNLTIVTCPPLCFWPHACLLVEFRDGWISISTHRVIPTIERSPDSQARDRRYVGERESWLPDLRLRLTANPAIHQ